MPAVERARRVSRSDWLEAGLTALATGGVRSVRVDALAKQLGVARSGFYWHFEDRDGLLAAMLDYWTRELTELVTRNPRILSMPATDRLLAIAHMVINHDLGRYDEAIRQWAREDPSVERLARRTFDLRLDIFEETFAELGFEGDELEMRVRLFSVYQAAEGAAIPPMSKAKRRRLAEIRVRMMMQIGRISGVFHTTDTRRSDN
jgi:AcrR family transcriptional regulator